MSSEERILFLFLIGLNSQWKIITMKEISPAVDDGGPSEQLKQGVSTDSTLPSSQQYSKDNTRLDSQRSCVNDEHISPTPPSQVLALT